MAYENCSSLGVSWCVADYILLAVSFIIFIMTVSLMQIVQYIKIYKITRTCWTSKDFVFIGQIFQTLAMSVHYIFIEESFNFVFLIQECMLSIQYSLVFYYFFNQLSDNMNNLKKIKLPLIVLNILMIGGFFVYVFLDVEMEKPLYNCNDGIWIYLNCYNIILSIIFVLLGKFADKSLYFLQNSQRITLDTIKIKQFWWVLRRIIVLCVFIGSLINFSESLFYIHVDNENCYQSYTNNDYANIVIFLVIRLSSHYIFLGYCLFVFRLKKEKKVKLESDSDKSLKNELVLDDCFESSKISITLMSY